MSNLRFADRNGFPNQPPHHRAAVSVQPEASSRHSDPENIPIKNMASRAFHVHVQPHPPAAPLGNAQEGRRIRVLPEPSNREKVRGRDQDCDHSKMMADRERVAWPEDAMEHERNKILSRGSSRGRETPRELRERREWELDQASYNKNNPALSRPVGDPYNGTELNRWPSDTQIRQQQEEEKLLRYVYVYFVDSFATC
jgi:hypothetical protein